VSGVQVPPPLPNSSYKPESANSWGVNSDNSYPIHVSLSFMALFRIRFSSAMSLIWNQLELKLPAAEPVGFHEDAVLIRDNFELKPPKCKPLNILGV